MHIKTRNVASAFETLVTVLHTGGYGGEKVPVVRSRSRNGDVLMIDEPVTVTYSAPLERVLLNPVRDANPFFHLYEALWMLAGRNDVASVSHYAKQMKEYSDDGKTLNGAYGYRWRNLGYGCDFSDWHNAITVDQLQLLIDHLKANPTSRRAVLTMWNVEDDLLKVDKSKDVCCNTSVMFSLRQCGQCDGGGTYRGRYTPDDPNSPVVEEPCENHETHLDMTVTNRSNDLLWGMLGANHVHFAFLQEYMAAHLGVEVGRYHHFTNNLHVYADRPDWRPVELLDACHDPYGDGLLTHPRVPLVKNPGGFDSELPWFVTGFDGTDHNFAFEPARYEGVVGEPFLDTVAKPMLTAHYWHRRGDTARALRWADTVADPYWKMAAAGWLSRRYKGVQTV